MRAAIEAVSHDSNEIEQRINEAGRLHKAASLNGLSQA